jgi:tetratricopeptide (TPR) repeat protein
MPDGRALTRALTEEALMRFRKLDHPRYIARTLNNLGEMARLDGDDNQAEQYYRESLAIQQRYSGQTTLLTPQLNLGYIMLHRGQARQALAMLRETGAVLREQDLHSYSLGLVLLIAAGARGQLGEWQTGIRLLGSCVATMERLNVAFVVLDYVDQYEYDLIQAELRKQCDEATFETLWAEGHAMPFHEALAYVLGEISPTAQG